MDLYLFRGVNAPSEANDERPAILVVVSLVALVLNDSAFVLVGYGWHGGIGVLAPTEGLKPPGTVEENRTSGSSTRRFRRSNTE